MFVNIRSQGCLSFFVLGAFYCRLICLYRPLNALTQISTYCTHDTVMNKSHILLYSNCTRKFLSLKWSKCYLFTLQCEYCTSYEKKVEALLWCLSCMLMEIKETESWWIQRRPPHECQLPVSKPVPEERNLCFKLTMKTKLTSVNTKSSRAAIGETQLFLV